MTYTRKYNIRPRLSYQMPFKRVPNRGVFAFGTGIVGQAQVKVTANKSQYGRQFGLLNTMINPRHPYRCLATGQVIFYGSLTTQANINQLCYVPIHMVAADANHQSFPPDAPAVVVDHNFNE